MKKESTFFRIGGKSIVDLAAMDIADLHKWMSGINRYFNDQQKEIAREIVKGITERLSFLIDLGVDYLT